MRFNIDFWEYAKKALPPKLRKVRQLDWIKALVWPLQRLNEVFIDFVQKTFYKVSFTGQVKYLEHILNDRYDSTLRRIYIEDGLQMPLPPYLYNKVEQRPLYIWNKAEAHAVEVYLRNKAEYRAENDFIVYVPTAILNPALEKAIRSLVKIYKIAGKRFSVVGV